MRYLPFAVALSIATSTSLADAPLHIPSDAKARYTIIQRDTEGTERTITTKREGADGTSYSKRLYNCSEHTVKYLGTGDSLERMNASSPDLRMGAVVTGSIADYIGGAACQ